MKNVILLLAVCFSLGVVSCDERQIPLFEGSNELYFNLPYVNTERDDADTVFVSFFFYKESTTALDIPLYVHLSGDMLETPGGFLLESLAGETSLPAENYKLGEYVYPKGQTIDTIIFNVFPSEHLKTKVDTLVLTFKKNDVFGLGQREYVKRIVLVTAEPLRPAWWNNKFSLAMLGQYSQKKLRLFVNLVSDEVGDVLLFDELDEALQRKACLRFKYWLDAEEKAGRTVYDEDGQPMRVRVIG